MSYYQGVFEPETIKDYLSRQEIGSDEQKSLLKSAYTISVSKNEQMMIDLEKVNVIHVLAGVLSVGISDAQGQPTTLGLLPSGGNLVVGNWMPETGIAMELRSLGDSELMVISTNFIHSYHRLSMKTERILNKLSAHTLGRFLNAEAQKRTLNSLEAMELIVTKLSQQADTILLSSEEFAELIGCSRQQASRNLNMMKEQGLIERCYGGFQVVCSADSLAIQQLRADSFPVL